MYLYLARGLNPCPMSDETVLPSFLISNGYDNYGHKKAPTFCWGLYWVSWFWKLYDTALHAPELVLSPIGLNRFFDVICKLLSNIFLGLYFYLHCKDEFIFLIWANLFYKYFYIKILELYTLYLYINNIPIAEILKEFEFNQPCAFKCDCFSNCFGDQFVISADLTVASFNSSLYLWNIF